MKKKDIEIGKYYAVGSQRSVDAGYAAKYLVLEKDVERTYIPEGTYRHRTAMDGIKVQLITPNTGVPAQINVVHAASVRESWDSYETRINERKDKDEEHRRSRERKRQANINELHDIMSETSFEKYRSRLYSNPEKTKGFFDHSLFSDETVSLLLEVARDAYDFGTSAP